MEVRDFFRSFLKSRWEPEFAYTAEYFNKHYKFSQHISRYHLNNLVRDGKLICLVINSRNYYMLPKKEEQFRPYCNKVKGVSIVKNISLI